MRGSRSHTTSRVVLVLLVLECALSIPALALFGIAAPNTFRTALWKDGGLNGFNSDPVQILYAYANHRPLPQTPMVWHQFITNWNVAISIASLFVLLIEAVLHVMHIMLPSISLVVHVSLTALWAVSVHGQAGSDYSDPAHPSSRPWYLTKNCSVAFKPNNVHYCKLAKATFAVTVLMLCVYVVHIPVAIYGIFMRRKERRHRDAASEADLAMTKGSPQSDISRARSWEMYDVPRTPARTPVTPRTQAFNTLSANA